MNHLPFGTPDTNRLAGLLFDLASQLHVERAYRMALEARLVRLGVITRHDLESEAKNSDTRADMARALDDSMRQMMRVLGENADPRVPLRTELNQDGNGR